MIIMIIAELSGRHRQSPIVQGEEGKCLREALLVITDKSWNSLHSSQQIRVPYPTFLNDDDDDDDDNNNNNNNNNNNMNEKFIERLFHENMIKSV